MAFAFVFALFRGCSSVSQTVKKDLVSIVEADVESSIQDEASWKKEVEETVEMLDDGRLFLRFPKGWKLAPRSVKYVVLLRHPTQKGVCFYVTASKAPQNVRTLSIENADLLRESLPGNSKFQKIVMRGPSLFVPSSHVSSSETNDFDNRVLATVQNGRCYNLVLRAYRGEMTDEMVDILNAVAANVRFSKSTVEPALPTGTDTGTATGTLTKTPSAPLPDLSAIGEIVPNAGRSRTDEELKALIRDAIKEALREYEAEKNATPPAPPKSSEPFEPEPQEMPSAEEE